ncbi:uncharacterized protein LOC119985757 [Tripterygium wilfordii]|uniref:uncharacterized protein LOC119985757 n=1 Tax=Tripterygium wilfordii TaxID=458696 RepID=UPI0018F8215D|nr:uncharacterized protein LOC119985757 [Tripterygium wilfordii]
MEVLFDSEDLYQVKKRKKYLYQVEDKVHEPRDLPVTLQFQWFQTELHFDFDALNQDKDKIIGHIRHELLDASEFVETRVCRISKFADEDNAWMVRDILLTVLGHFGPYLPFPFQVEADSSWYLPFLTEGALFRPSREKLYESCTLYDDGHVFFPSISYKSILRDIIGSVWILSDTQLRCRLSLENIYIVEYDGTCMQDRATFAKFLRFDLRERLIDDKVEVREELKKLFEEINSKCNVDGGSKFEFDLFLKNFTLEHITKPSSFDDTKGVSDTSMKKCIETIRDLYFNFERLKQQLENMGVKPKLQDAEQVVDYIHYIFPYLIGALAERAFAMKWDLNMSFDEPNAPAYYFFPPNPVEVE